MDLLSLLLGATLGAIVFLLRSYLTEKGKNYATKQDVKDITQKIEGVKADIARSSSIDEQKRRLKYDGCMEALVFIDAYLSHLFLGDIDKQYFSTENARKVHSQLILSCDNIELIQKFNEIIFKKDPPCTTDDLNLFRNMIRNELGFGNELPLDRDRAWIGKTVGNSELAEKIRPSVR